jgi:hypothetical protein
MKLISELEYIIQRLDYTSQRSETNITTYKKNNIKI